MTDRIDNLFSPERLRKKWVRSPAAQNKESGQDENSGVEPYVNIVSALRHTVSGRFSEGVTELVDVLLNELEVQLAARFPAGRIQPVLPEQMMALNQTIDQILIQIEDLAETG